MSCLGEEGGGDRGFGSCVLRSVLSMGVGSEPHTETPAFPSEQTRHLWKHYLSRSIKSERYNDKVEITPE